MRILFISHNFIPQPTSYGSAIHIWTIINAMRECGHQVDVLIYGVPDYSADSGWRNPQSEELVKTLESAGFIVSILPKKIPAPIQKKGGLAGSIINAAKRLISPEPIDYYEGPFYRDEIEAYANSINADAVVAYSFEAVSAACAALKGIPIAASTVDLDHVVRVLRKPKLRSFSPKAVGRDLFERMMLSRLSSVEVSLLNNCDLVYSHAAQHCRWLQEHGVKNAVYLPVAVPDNALRLMGKPKESNDPLRIIMVGDVTATATRMGLRFLTDHILPGLDALWHKNRGFELQIFGSGKLDDQTSKNMDLEWIRIMGFVEDIGTEFHNSDILLVPTPDNVGFRTRISEGFSYGCCVVTHVANTLGMPELKDGENSLICKTGRDFSAAISNCLDSLELRQRLSAAARRTFEDKLDGTKGAKKMVSAIEAAVARPRP